LPTELPNYKTVPERIAEFAEKYPDGRLRQVSVEFLRDFGGADWIVYTAAALREEGDKRPGHGTAWERVPGLTNFTRNSEMQNAETSAWGRAIVATLAADTSKSDIATLEDKQSRTAERDPKALKAAIDAAGKAKTKGELRTLYTVAVGLGMDKKKAAELRDLAETLPEGDEEAAP
jgi:hypothetical protein